MPVVPEGDPGDPLESSGLGTVGSYEDSLQLLTRYRDQGDPAALNALLARYYERVRRIARIRMGPRLQRWTESDDLVQNTFAVAFRKLRGFEVRDHSSLIQYLSRVLENQIRDAVQYFDAPKRNPSPGQLVSADAVAAGEEDEPRARAPRPEEEAVSREFGEIYDECVRDLDPLHREVVLLREYADASWTEIREALDRPTEHAARLLYSRAQIKLADRLRRRLGR